MQSAPVVVVSCGLLVCGCAGAATTITTENDLYSVGNRDRWYTNGLRVAGVYRTDATPPLVRDIAERLPRVSNDDTTQIGWIAGQDMYTPGDTSLDPPDPADRPYGGWLYAGVLVSKATRAEDGPEGDSVHVLEVDLGVVGPPSLAGQTQVSYHHLIDVDRPQGWEYELRYEPGIVVQYEQRRRLLAGGSSEPGPESRAFAGEWDLIGVGNLTAGNIFTHGSLGAIGRWGNELRRDFGPSTIHSAAVDVPHLTTTRDFRWYLFGGVEGRAVARNIFLDGNTWRDSPSVDKEPFLAELRAGLAIEWGSLRLTYTNINRTREFEDQESASSFGSISLTFESQF
ncbi:MAG: lipid A deacylase LpxR family protein [Planctomycetes bacterium]|nr:lipid A deacylase LpxR family protein [Planctomycetota bacterium]